MSAANLSRWRGDKSQIHLELASDDFRVNFGDDQFVIVLLQCKYGTQALLDAGQFEMDLAFVSAPPAEIRRGQTVQLRLQLGAVGDALLLGRGGFFQETGGNWVFVLNRNESFAERRNIRLGRRNPRFFEVLDGLEAGEKVIVSDYAAFGEMDRITFKN